MKNKIIASLLIVMLLLTNYAYALTYTRTDGSNVNNIATLINSGTYMDVGVGDLAGTIAQSEVKVYNYNTETEQTCTGNTAVDYSLNKYYLRYEKIEVNNNEHLCYAIRLPGGNVTLNNVATLLFKQSIRFAGKKYDVKLNITKIDTTGSSAKVFQIPILNRAISSSNIWDQSTYTDGLWPQLEFRDMSSSNTCEVKAEYYILDSDGNEFPVTGFFEIIDLDENEGLHIEDFIANAENTYKRATLSDTVKYKTANGGTYFYSTTNENIGGEQINPYLLLRNKSKHSITVTKDEGRGNVGLFYAGRIVNTYKRINTKVTGGTITPTITGITNGENKTVEYAPNDSSKQYLKSIKVDGEEQNLETYANSYTFSNIAEDHEITVEYANKYKVDFDAKGGSPTPETQYVSPNGTVTKPATNPTKEGYTFDGWIKKDGSSPYNFTELVNSAMVLEAKWKPISYKINYVLNGGTNDSRNPSTYTIEDTINLQPATKQGYTFQGWFEKSDFTNPIDGVSNRTGDITAYAKWKERGDIEYKVEHYKKNKAGEYTLATTDTLSGTVNETVTASPKDFIGYSENTTYEGRVATGKIKADGSLVLKLYYDLNVYKIDYVLNGGKNNPNNPTTYTVEDKVNFKPATKQGYDFKGWYEDPEFKTELPGLENKTGEIKVYAKWGAKEGTEYKVEHYKKNKAGEYKLAVTDSLTGKTDEQITATPKNFAGYSENTTYEGRVATGKIKADGSLVLKLYYDLNTYKIDYELNGGTNNPKNPSTYTVEDIVDFQPATKPGYDFKGWYEDSNFKTPIAGIADRTGELKVYAKWEAKKDIEYKVEHYKEKTEGKYELVVTDTLTGTMDTKVTAKPKTFTGYSENTTYEGRVATGTIKADGSLVLKLYYNKIRYTITFDPDNGTKMPEQIVPYQEKAKEPTKPTKDGYTFDNWYYKDKDGKEKVYDFNTPVTSAINLVAKWKEEAKPDVAPTPIPQTGDFNPIIAVFVVIAILGIAVFGIKYLKLTNKIR